jgi:hypothetical protein
LIHTDSKVQSDFNEDLMKLFQTTLSAVAVMLFATTTYAQTTGMVRDRLIDKAQTTCSTKQRAERPVSVSDAAIASFCKCNGTFIADKMTNDQAMAMRGTDKTIDPALLATANQACESKLK